MSFILHLLILLGSSSAHALPEKYRDLLPFVQPAPDQGDANTCLFMASTGAMELLLNKKENIRTPDYGGPFDLSESFLIWQKAWVDKKNPSSHFIESAVKSFNFGEAVLEKDWPFIAFNPDGSGSNNAWLRHPDFTILPRIPVPPVKTELLFSRGRKYATRVLRLEDITAVKKALVERESPVIINYNDDDYWHVVLIVGYDDNVRGDCYQITENECQKTGAFFVRDSNGKRLDVRSYSWFLVRANAAAVIELQ